MNATFIINSSCLAVAALSVASSARANPRPLPYTYPYETLSAEEMEIEQYVDITPVRIEDPEAPATGRLWDQRYVLQTELEYGITDRLELGLYLVFGNDAGGSLAFDGVKQRLRLRLAEQGEWPIDVALYGELAEFHDEFEIEEKLILQKRFDRIRLMTNIWFEQELERYEGELELIFHPTFGVTGEITPNWHLGAEYWAVGKFENEGTPGTVDHFNDSFHHYVGPAVSLQFGKFWWSTAAYLRLDGMSRTSEPGEKYGHLWVRTVLGLAL
ncbi:MAG TPA: hypothetical protein VF881_15870 [Polyangiaceae bacterium]